jgi:hypothetical protein
MKSRPTMVPMLGAIVGRKEFFYVHMERKVRVVFFYACSRTDSNPACIAGNGRR